MDKNSVKVSIITVCLNSEKTIEKTILSVLGQSYKNIEHIVIDGASTDKTIEIINKYKKRISMLVSEKDQGVYDGMNKGIKLAHGQVIAFLNSDDFYTNNLVVEKIMKAFQDKKCGGVYGDLMFINKNYKSPNPLKLWRPGMFSLRQVLSGWHIPHPTFFVRRDFYKKFGNFDTNFTISADYDLMTRFFLKGKLQPIYLPETLVQMRRGGSSTQLKNKLKMWFEVYQIFRKNNLRNPLLLLAKRFVTFHRSLIKVR